MQATAFAPPPPATERPLPPEREASVLPAVVAAAAFCLLYSEPLYTLASAWWNEPDAGHGLLLAPLALYLAWRRGLLPDSPGQRRAGLILLASGIALRYGSGLAAELFTMRLSVFMAAAGLIVYLRGFRQLGHWWLAVALLLLAIPLPAVVLGSLALPLQLQASKLGAALLEWRHVPVLLSGNVLHLPGRSLFVTEACSGLRSLTALLSLAVLIGGIGLGKPWSRVLLVAVAVPLAVLVNGVRVFLTGFLVYYVDPRFGDGLMHYTEGWALFVLSFILLGIGAWVLVQVEQAMGAVRES